jgi:Aldo/keto reductase family
MVRQAEAFKMNMELADIPGTSLKVSPVAIGTWAIGGWMWGGTDEAESVSTIHAALEHGINIIDTAPVYGFGRSEEIVGRAIAEARVRACLIATKAGLEWEDGRVFRNASRARIMREIEDSLVFLGTAWTVARARSPRHAGRLLLRRLSRFDPAAAMRCRKALLGEGRRVSEFDLKTPTWRDSGRVAADLGGHRRRRRGPAGLAAHQRRHRYQPQRNRDEERSGPEYEHVRIVFGCRKHLMDYELMGGDARAAIIADSDSFRRLYPSARINGRPRTRPGPARPRSPICRNRLKHAIQEPPT